MDHLVVFGLGYTGTAIARLAAVRGMRVSGTSRRPADIPPLQGVDIISFTDAATALASATHVVATAAPDQHGDPVIAMHATALRTAPSLRWAGYLSTTGVYGDRDGAWVDETTPVAPGSDRSRRRIEAELEWMALSDRLAVDIFRVAGIYGPGRSAFDDIRSGRARRVLKPGHAFGRIHRDDIAGAVLAAASQTLPPGPRILHLADDVPAESATVIEEAARLLGVAPPPTIPFDAALAGMSEMARSFWAENRKVASARTQELLGRRWTYPSYREGLEAILHEKRGDDLAQQ